MKHIALIVIIAMGITIPTAGTAGTTNIMKKLSDRQICHTIKGNQRTVKNEVRGTCVYTIWDAKCPKGRCTMLSKPSKYGQCPSGGNLSDCPSGREDVCGSYTLEKLVGEPDHTECTTKRGGYLKSEIIYPDEIELREGEHAEIKVKGDCTAITIGSKGGRIIPREERVCGTGNVKITKRPGAEGADYVEIKAQIVQ
ncbi:hypothetical protein A8W72_004263 [Escherichia coli]|nr:hypothetical protein [Escherichia coli]